MAQKQRKARCSYTLSVDSVSFIEKQKRARRLRSASAALDELLKELQHEIQQLELSAAMQGYYDSMSDAEASESKTWGELAETQFPLE